MEVSSIGVGRSPASIRSVAMLTGVNVVLGCGYYTKYALPQEVVDESEAILTENLINEIQYGIGDTGIRRLKVNLERVVICHVDAQSKPDYQREVLKTGAYLEFDHFGEEFYVETADFLMDRDYDRIDAMQTLIEEGYTDQLLMSQDVCLKTDLVSFGGWGYAHILRNIVPIMRTRGWESRTIEAIMVDNPKKLLNVGP